MTDPSLRVAIMCRGTTFPRWQADAIRHLLAVPGVTVPLLIVDPRRAEAAPVPLAKRLRDPALVWRLYNNRWVARRSAALHPIDLRDELRDAAVVRCDPERRGRWSEHLLADDLEFVRSHEPDVILRFAYGILRGEILDLPRHGIWSYHHGDIERYRGGPPAFWEIARGDDVTGVTLQRLTDRLDGGVVLRRGWFATVRHSYVRNADRVRLGATEWPAQVCKAVLDGATPADDEPTSSEAPIDHNPTTFQLARTLGAMAGRWITHQARSVALAERWRVGVVDQPIRDILERGITAEPRWLDPPSARDGYLADPFPADPAGGHTIVAEHYSYRSRVGRIVRLELSEPDLAVMSTGSDAHASYPCTVPRGNSVLCTPQITGRGVHLFELAPTGLRELTTIAEDVRALDPTLVHHGGTWWLFFTDGDAGAMTHLHAWYAPDPEGPWIAHRDNPVKVDVRSSRPGGTPFVVDGRLYRPAQDCARTYGAAIVINRVDALSPSEFREAPVMTLRPSGWVADAGCHTLAAWGEQCLVDAKEMVLSARKARAEISARVRRRRTGASRS